VTPFGSSWWVYFSLMPTKITVRMKHRMNYILRRKGDMSPPEKDAQNRFWGELTNGNRQEGDPSVLYAF
jgi:hypothetical protein